MAKILPNRIILVIFILALSACGTDGTSRNSGPKTSIANDNPEGLVRVGEGFERSGNLKSALDLYEQAIVSNPDLLSAQIAKARLLTRTSRREEGIASLVSILEEDPENRASLIALTQGYVYSDKYADALKTIEAFAERDDADLQVLDLAGILSDVNLDSAKAKVYYDRALKFNPNDTNTIRHLAVSFALDKEYQSAIALLQPILNLQTTERLAKQTLANIYALSGQIDASNLIAQATFESDKLKEWDLIYQLIGQLTQQEQAVFLLLDIVPQSVTERIQKTIPKPQKPD